MEHYKSFKSYKDIASGKMSYSKRIIDCSKLNIRSKISTELEIDCYSSKDWYFQVEHMDTRKVSKLDEWYL
jgi:hypothetical protein